MTGLTDRADEAPGLPSSSAVAVADPVTGADRLAQSSTSVSSFLPSRLILVVWGRREWQSRLLKNGNVRHSRHCRKLRIEANIPTLTCDCAKIIVSSLP